MLLQSASELSPPDISGPAHRFRAVAYCVSDRALPIVTVRILENASSVEFPQPVTIDSVRRSVGFAKALASLRRASRCRLDRPVAGRVFCAWKRGRSDAGSLASPRLTWLGRRGTVTRRFPLRSSTAMLPSQRLEITQGW